MKKQFLILIIVLIILIIILTAMGILFLKTRKDVKANIKITETYLSAFSNNKQISIEKNILVSSGDNFLLDNENSSDYKFNVVKINENYIEIEFLGEKTMSKGAPGTTDFFKKLDRVKILKRESFRVATITLDGGTTWEILYKN